MTKKEIAALLDLKPRQIDNLVVDGMPRTKVGRTFDYPPRAIAWYYKRKQAEQKKGASTLSSARLRFESARAETAELELERLRASQIPMERHLDLVTLIGSRIRSRLLAMPAKFSPRTVGKKSVAASRKVWEDAVYEVLDELSQLTLAKTNGDKRSNSNRRARRTRRQ